ncbi:MAG: hypothetical protein ACRC5C_06525 [Bacilli bacterium]
MRIFVPLLLLVCYFTAAGYTDSLADYAVLRSYGLEYTVQSFMFYDEYSFFEDGKLAYTDTILKLEQFYVVFCCVVYWIWSGIRLVRNRKN